jgi:YVTN family beta-propeller protein
VAGLGLALGIAGTAAAAPATHRVARQAARPGKVFVLNTATDQIRSSFQVGRVPLAAALTPDGSQLLVANYGSGTVTAIRFGGRKTVFATIRVGTEPDYLAVAGGGQTVYVASRGRAGAILTPISTGTDRAGKPVPAGDMISALTVSPDGKTIYAVTDNYITGREEVIPVRVRTNRPGRPIVIGSWRYAARTALITPGGKTLDVLSFNGYSAYKGLLTPVDLSTRRPGRAVPVGAWPVDMAMTPDGRKIFVSSQRGIVPILTASDRVLPAISDPNSDAIVLSPDGRTAFTVFAAGLIPITVATDKAGPFMGPGRGEAINGNPGTMAISHDGKTLYVTSIPGAPAGVVPFDLATKTAERQIKFGVAPRLIVMTPSGQVAYIIDPGP